MIEEAIMRRPLMGAVAGADALIGKTDPAGVPHLLLSLVLFREPPFALVARSITRPVAILETGATEREFFLFFIIIVVVDANCVD